MGQPKNFLCGATCFAAREKTAKRHRTPDVVPYLRKYNIFCDCGQNRRIAFGEIKRVASNGCRIMAAPRANFRIDSLR